LPPPPGAEWSAGLLLTLPPLRQVLSAAFDALRDEGAAGGGPHRRRLWAGLLSAAAESHLLALHDHAGRLREWSSCLPSLPPAPAAAVLDALLPLVPLHGGFGSHLLLLLRKLLAAPHAASRGLASHGWAELLRRGLLRGGAAGAGGGGGAAEEREADAHCSRLASQGGPCPRRLEDGVAVG
jgi:hypothetical protein